MIALAVSYLKAILDKALNKTYAKKAITEKEHLITASLGEGILMMENDHQELTNSIVYINENGF